jgi:P-type Cu2+ transporter
MNCMNTQSGRQGDEVGSDHVASQVRVFEVEGATCGHCTGRIERFVRGLNGVESASFDLATKRLTVTDRVDMEAPASEAIISGLTADGYPAKALNPSLPSMAACSVQLTQITPISFKNNAPAANGHAAPATNGAARKASETAKESGPQQRLEFAVEGVSCPACMVKIEGTLSKLPGIDLARYNLSKHRLAVVAQTGAIGAAEIIRTLEDLGYRARPFAEDATERDQAKHETLLLKSMAVAGFASANIMMLMSIPMWAGQANQMDMETHALLQWFSALIALPAAAYAGQVFYKSAWGAVSHGRMNMDVPISLAVILSLVMSVIETTQHAEETYYDSAVMLLFFLLIGRFLDYRSRRQTRNLGLNLLALQKPTASRLAPDGTLSEVSVGDIRPGDHVLAAAGGRIPIDGVVVSGSSYIDESLITGESEPQLAEAGKTVYAGTLNLKGALTVQALAAGDNTLLAEIGQLMDKASEKRGEYIRLADRMAQWYAPGVHFLAGATFLGWLLFMGAGWQTSLLNAIAVLIITCPCALGLAVPVVQVVATGSLFRMGILVNSGDALERLALADTVVFDKTGTLTEPDPAIANLEDAPADDLELAARLALSSHHILAKTLAKHIKNPTPFGEAQEFMGAGVQAVVNNIVLKLGSREFCGVEAPASNDAASQTLTELWFRKGDGEAVVFRFAQRLRSDAREVVADLLAQGYRVEILSGDKEAATRGVAETLNVKHWHGAMKPQDKIRHVEELRAQGRNVLMVGDGLNDAAALQAANVSAAPATALDITQAAADIIMIGSHMSSLTTALVAGKKARGLMLQNFGLAMLYNVVAVPVAIVGLVTPLFAALAMSTSSIVVTLNALRAQVRARGKK